MLSIEEIIKHIEHPPQGGLLRDFLTLKIEREPVEKLTQVTDLVAGKFFDAFLATLDYGTQIGNKVLNHKYDNINEMVTKHQENEGTIQYYKNILGIMERKGIDLSAQPNVKLLQSLYRKYLHDNDVPLSVAAHWITMGEPDNKIAAMGRHILHINSYLISKITGDGSFNYFNLTKMCKDIAAYLKIRDPTFDCKFTGRPININGHPSGIYVAILNVCKNGINYGNKRVSGTIKREGKFAVVSIADCGTGIPTNKISTIEKEGVSYQGSSGLGLAIATDVIRKLHDGDIQYGYGKIPPYTGAEVRLLIPVKQA